MTWGGCGSSESWLILIENLWALVGNKSSWKFKFLESPSWQMLSALIFKKEQNLSFLTVTRQTTEMKKQNEFEISVYHLFERFLWAKWIDFWFHELFSMLSSVISSTLVYFLAPFQFFNQKLPTRLHSICSSQIVVTMWMKMNEFSMESRAKNK